MTDRWWDRAGCIDDDRIDPALPGLNADKRDRIAAFYCLGCPVVTQCAQDALEHRDIGVIRAGTFIGASRAQPTRTSRRRLAAIAERTAR